MGEYIAAVEAGTAKERGWVRGPCDVGKAGAMEGMGCLALEQMGRGIGVYSCCPGYVRTGMSPGRTRNVVNGNF